MARALWKGAIAFGLVNIPILGKIFFGSDHTEKDRQQLMIALIPHIVRTPDYTAENLRGIYAGTDQVVKLNYAPKQGETPLVAAPAPTGGAAVIPAPSPAGPAPAPTAAAPIAALVPATPQGSARVSFVPAAIQSASGGTTSVTVQIENVTDLASVSALRIKFDSAQMRLDDIVPGDLLSRDGARLASVKDIRNDVGEATITITRPPGAGSRRHGLDRGAELYFARKRARFGHHSGARFDERSIAAHFRGHQ